MEITLTFNVKMFGVTVMTRSVTLRKGLLSSVIHAHYTEPSGTGYHFPLRNGHTLTLDLPMRVTTENGIVE